MKLRLKPPKGSGYVASNRMALARLIANDVAYRSTYQALFGPVPDLTDALRFPENASPDADAKARAAWEKMTSGDRLLAKFAAGRGDEYALAAPVPRVGAHFDQAVAFELRERVGQARLRHLERARHGQRCLTVFDPD